MTAQSTPYSSFRFSEWQLTPMQEAMYAAAQREGVVRLLSPTGSGKTWAFLHPLAERLRALKGAEGASQCTEKALKGAEEAAQNTPRALKAVVVAPSRELVQQIAEVWRALPDAAPALTLHGGRPAMEEHRRLREVQPTIVFATPGRLLDHVGKQNISLHEVDVLVFDEFDKCFQLGFQDEVGRIMQACASARRLWLTSATATPEAEAFLSTQKAAQGVRTLDFSQTSDARLYIYKVYAPVKDKLDTLARLLSHLEGAPAIVFLSYRESVERVGHFLKEQRFTATLYHGGMEQEARERALFRFRCGAANVLVCTDLAARGLDIPEVAAVVHYHLPASAEAFTHRSGRTTRWEREGRCFLIIGPEEQVPEFVPEAQVFDALPLQPHPTRPAFTCLYIGRGRRDKISRGDIVGFLCKKGGLSAQDLGRIEVFPTHAYAAVRTTRVKALLQRVATEKIKGQRTLIEVMRH